MNRLEMLRKEKVKEVFNLNIRDQDTMFFYKFVIVEISKSNNLLDSFIELRKERRIFDVKPFFREIFYIRKELIKNFKKVELIELSELNLTNILEITDLKAKIYNEFKKETIDQEELNIETLRLYKELKEEYNLQ